MRFVDMIEEKPNDDTAFLVYVNAVLANLRTHEVTGIYLTRIDGWFGERWIGFAGKTLGAAGVRYREDFHVPPFVPNRVLSTKYFRLVGSGEYVADTPPITLHITQRSESNFRRKLSDLTPDDALVWFTSDSAANGRGSLLAYVPAEGGHEAWFLGLTNNRGSWRINKSIGISSAELALSHA